MSVARAISIIQQVAMGVAAAHAAGVVHRDIKPANILFNSRDEVKVSDFGLAKRAAAERLTHTNDIVGTPAYMAPEQVRGDNKFVGPPADVWAVGIILYECLTGMLPFCANDTWALRQMILCKEPTSITALRKARDVPRDLILIVAKCIRKDATNRYQDASDLAEDLARLERGVPVVARPLSAVEKVYRWAKRNPSHALLAFIVIVLVIVIPSVGIWVQADREFRNAIAQKAIRERESALQAANMRELWSSPVVFENQLLQGHMLGRGKQLPHCAELVNCLLPICKFATAYEPRHLIYLSRLI